MGAGVLGAGNLKGAGKIKKLESLRIPASL